MTKAPREAGVIQRDIMAKAILGDKTSQGVRYKLVCFKDRSAIISATKFQDRVSTGRRKKYPENILSKELCNVLSHFLLGGDSTSKQRTEAILSVASILSAALVTRGRGEYLKYLCILHDLALIVPVTLFS